MVAVGEASRGQASNTAGLRVFLNWSISGRRHFKRIRDNGRVLASVSPVSHQGDADMRKIYVASSWRNSIQQAVVSVLRASGHEVYDFKNPAPGNTGFAWSEIDREWLSWTPENFARLLSTHPVAAAGFALDKGALDWCDTCVIVLPCGRSAHLEAGYAAGQGKQVFVLLHPDKFEPELMYLLCTSCAVSIDEIVERLT